MDATKRCRKCGEDKLLTVEFDTHKRDGYQANCRECNSKYHAQWYKEHKEQVKRSVARRNQEIREGIIVFLIDYLQAHPCVDCGNGNIMVLDFDHVTGDKVAHISTFLRDRRPLNELKDEIAKCEVRCKNCHTIRTQLLCKSWRTRVATPVGQGGKAHPCKG